MRLALFVLLIAAVLSDSTTAFAKTTSLPEGSDIKQPELKKLVREYARCLVAKRADVASDAILSNTPAYFLRKQFGLLFDSDCMSSATRVLKASDGAVSVVFSSESLPYALADALINARFAADGPANFDNRLPLAHRPLPDRAVFDAELVKTKDKRRRDALEKGFRDSFGAAWLSRFGECAVRKQPEKARLWLLTLPDGPEEVSRVSDFASAFAPCLPAEAGPVRFSRMTMRGTVAINYYRLAMATPQPSAGKPN